MVLEASTKFSMIDESVDKLKKTSVQFPSTSEDMIKRFKAQREFVILLFTVEYYIDPFYITLVKWNLKFRRIVDLRVVMDPKVIATYLVATDSRVNLYLGCCIESEYPMEMSVRWLDARGMYEIIEMNEFSYTLPMSVKPLNPSIAGTKIKSDGNQRQGERVTNNNMVDNWKLRPVEYYGTVFRHKVKDVPTLSIVCHV